ncbi:E3 ubiquitin-protein ligase RNF144B [Fagus crenata]
MRMKRQKIEQKPEQQRHDVVEVDDDDDDLIVVTPLSTLGHDKSNAISVEHYSAKKDLQQIQSSNSQSFIDLSDNDGDDEVRVLKFKPLANSNRPKRKSVYETGQSSSSKQQDDKGTFLCEICFEPKSRNECFSIKGCDHAYCRECMAKYVASKLQDNVYTTRCPVPECVGGLLELEHCRCILPKEVFDRWGDALCEALILGSQKFYCPYKDCSALLLNDGSFVITETECPHCWRLFCAQCKVPWHSGINCAQFQNLNQDERQREDIMLINLARDKGWIRCPTCRFYVAKSSGCKFMKCRCGTEFCYRCGTQTNSECPHICLSSDSVTDSSTDSVIDSSSLRVPLL